MGLILLIIVILLLSGGGGWRYGGPAWGTGSFVVTLLVVLLVLWLVGYRV